MALKLRKDIKKSSYYVWFLGAKESKGLRGSEYILPVIKHLEQREKDIEPFKVTLQVSHKGLKIIQNIVSQGPKNSKPKNETIKHFIPHNTITCVYQHEDIIACILLLFNPVTKCPLHVHAYRCDSLETATVLKQQLQTLIERPENQKKFSEIESRLKPVKEVKKVESSLGSDTGTSTRESESSSEERFQVENSRVTTLYDSVAAELREKLGKKNSPILLPPRDYDTVHRQKGNLTGIELRRCLNANIVGQNVKGRRIESSGGSSGIGSDHPPSPDSPEAPDSRFNTLDNQSTSDEDWNGDPADSTLYLMHPPAQMTLPRPITNVEREKSPEPIRNEHTSNRFSRYPSNDAPISSKYDSDDYKYNNNNRKSMINKREQDSIVTKNENITKYLEKPIAKFSDNKYLERQKSLEKEKFSKQLEQNEILMRQRKNLERQKSYETNNSKYYDDHDDNGEDYFEKSGRDIREEKARYSEELDRRFAQENMARKKMMSSKENERNNNTNVKEKPVKYFEDDGFNENVRYRSKSTEFERSPQQHSRGYTYGEEEFFEDNNNKRNKYPVPKTRSKYCSGNNEENSSKYYGSNNSGKELSRYHADQDSPKYHQKFGPDHQNLRYYSSGGTKEELLDVGMGKTGRPRSSRSLRNEDYFEEATIKRRSNAQYRQRSPSPISEDCKVSPRDRFKDAKEKFLLMERERLDEERKRPEPPISPVHSNPHLGGSPTAKEKNFVKRHESMMYQRDGKNGDRYIDDRYYDDRRLDEPRPKPAPRNVQLEEVRYRRHHNRDDMEDRDVPLERYRNTDKFDPKRRSMFSLIEEQHRKASNEIAKELKRRSYLETTSYDQEEIEYRASRERERERERSYQELPESDRYPLENYSKSNIELDKVGEMKYDQKFIKNQQKPKNSAGYRHSYAEPKLRMDKNSRGDNKKHFSEMLHRTNSSASNGRVGIASVHPY